MKRLIKQLKRFGDDERAVSPVVGFVLIFALIMIVFTIYQADVVPSQNEQVEYEHSQTIEGQMEQLSAAFLSADENGSTKSVALQLGVQYPSRALAINPGTPVGTLNTTGTYQVRLTGDAGSMELNTSFINYLPKYNMMQQETQYSIEHGLPVKDYEGSDNTRLVSTGALFSSDDETVNLRLISSNLQESRMSTVVTAENVQTHPITVTSGDTTLNLPTTLERSEWNRTITGSGQVDSWSYSDNGSGVNRVTIELKNGTAINVNRVTAGNPPPEGEIGVPPYLTNETPTLINASLNSTTNLTVRTVDIFGSPYNDVEINANTSGSEENLTPTNVISNSNGRAMFTYESAPSDADSTVEITASLANRTGENTSVTFELQYPDPDTDDGGDPSSGGGNADVSVDIGSSSTTNPKLHVSYDNPIEVSKFSMRTTDHGNLADLKITNNPNAYRYRFRLNDAEVQGRFLYESEDPIKLDGTVYNLTGPNVDPPADTSRVSDTDILIDKFDSGDGVNFTGVASSESDADMIITLIGPNGSEHPMYLNAEH